MDSYAAGSKNERFNRPDIRMHKIHDVQSTYGIVLAGESKKLHQCSHTYIIANRIKYFHRILELAQTIKVSLD